MDQADSHPAPSKDIPIPDDVLAKWQSIVDTMAALVDVPTGLVMRIVGDQIEVLISSEGKSNPYIVGASEHLLGSGLYCETVIRSGGRLLVPNALHDPHWKDNPDVKLNMLSYLGLPITWPDRTPFRQSSVPRAPSPTCPTTPRPRPTNCCAGARRAASPTS